MDRHWHERWCSGISVCTQAWTNTRKNDKFQQRLEVTSTSVHSKGPTVACGPLSR